MHTTSTIFLAFFPFFLAMAINSTNEANKAGRYRLLSSLFYLDVYVHKASSAQGNLGSATVTVVHIFEQLNSPI